MKGSRNFAPKYDGVPKKKIVVIGGGFAGINLIRSLSGSKEFSITLVDKNNYNFFPPLIYQVATGYLEPSSISFPFRKLFRKKNVSFFNGELITVIPHENKVVLSTGELAYDHLVLATGTVPNYFGMDNIRTNAIPMKTIDDALNMRNTFLQRVERASRTEDESEKKKLLSVVIAGGGPTGVEVAGMFAEMKRSILPREYPELAHFMDIPNIYLVDGLETLLSPMSEQSQKYTLKSLTEMGVIIRLNTQVADFNGDCVSFKDGSSIDTHNLVWAAGVTGTEFPGIPETCYGRGRRLIVDGYSKVKGFSNIYAIGDIALVSSDAHYVNGHPQVAQVAMQQGVNLGLNLKNTLKNRPLAPFSYKDKGSMAIIGRNKAVADLSSKIQLKGFIAWLLWIFVHVMSLINYRNRVRTLFNWSGSYFTGDQSFRLIIRPQKEQQE